MIFVILLLSVSHLRVCSSFCDLSSVHLTALSLAALSKFDVCFIEIMSTDATDGMSLMLFRTTMHANQSMHENECKSRVCFWNTNMGDNSAVT